MDASRRVSGADRGRAARGRVPASARADGAAAPTIDARSRASTNGTWRKLRRTGQQDHGPVDGGADDPRTFFRRHHEAAARATSSAEAYYAGELFPACASFDGPRFRTLTLRRQLGSPRGAGSYFLINQIFDPHSGTWWVGENVSILGEMTEPRRQIRFFPDTGHPWPLWETSPNARTPEDYGLSDELTKGMRNWVEHWEAHFDPFRGWDADESAAWSRAEGDLLIADLRKEVGAYADVVDRRLETGTT